MSLLSKLFKKKPTKRAEKYRHARGLGASSVKAHKMMHYGKIRFQNECAKLASRLHKRK